MDLQVIQNKIFEVRGCRVMLDFHLAELYQVETRALKQAVKRNIGRFPSDFMFVLSKEEANLLLSIGRVCQNACPLFFMTKPRLSQAEALLCPKDFVSSSIIKTNMAKIHFRSYNPNQIVLFPQRID